MQLARLSYLAVCLSLLPLAAHAHHEGDPIGELINEASTLNSVVQSSWLRPNVKYAVQHFVGDISVIEECETGLPQVMDHQVMDHQGPSCRDEVRHVQIAWNRVQRYLYDTNYDFPQVYNQYLRTRYALQQALAYMGQ